MMSNENIKQEFINRFGIGSFGREQMWNWMEDKINDRTEEAARICQREWHTLAPNMNYLNMEHIPIEGTQKEMFGFINLLMVIRAQEIRKLKG